MGNQYSITLSDESARIIEILQESGYKTSHAIDEAIKTLGSQALARLMANRLFRQSMTKED